ncbi:MAG: UDP-3-O-(3-hydroxymyristoyl)glucosamine N-acyltransferase [Planctomycetota bacterium]
MTIRLSELAEFVGGTVIGDPDLTVQGANPPTEASCTDITLLDDASRVQILETSQAPAVVTAEAIENSDFAQVVVKDPHAAFAKIVGKFRPPIESVVPEAGIDASAEIDPTAIIHPTAVIAAGTKIGPNCRVMPGVVILQNCEIGAGCVLHAGVTLYEYTRLGDRVVIHAGTVVGAYGFGYRQHEGKHLPTAQLGYVDIGSDVEVGAGATIDRGTYGPTCVGEGTKIDNQVMIAHNCQIGRHNLICSQVGIAGSCTTGDYVVLAGQVGLKDHIRLGDQTIVGAQAGVMDDCDGNQVLLGSPATKQREQMQIMAAERRLPEMRRELRQLQKDMQALKKQIVETTEENETDSGRQAA